MKKHDQLHQIDRQKLVHYLQKTTQLLLNIFNMIKATPLMIQISNFIDYAKNLQSVVQQLFKILPKKCIPIQVFKKLQFQSLDKQQKINKLLQNQKNLKIQVKVLEEKLQQAELKLKERQIKPKEIFIPQSLQKILHNQKSQKTQKPQKQYNFIQIADRYNFEKNTLLPNKKKRFSLPYLSASSSQLPSSQKITRSNNPLKKNAFVNVPGQGNQILIQHLMNKFITK